MFLALLLVVAGCSSGGSTAANGSSSTGSSTSTGGGSDEITLQMKPKEGDTYTYVTKIGSGPSQNMEMTMAMKAAKVTDSEILMESKIEGMSMNGNPAPPQATAMFKDMVIKTTMDKTGKNLKTEVIGGPPSANNSNQSNAMPASYPNHPVKVGDTWDADTDFNGTKTKMTFKFVKKDTVNGMEAAMLEATPDAGSPVKFDGPMMLSVEIATGMPINMKANIDSGGQKGSVEMTRK